MIGILLTNLGTPDAPTPQAVKKYLAEFLSDPRVIEIPKLLWWPILHGIVLRTRPQKSAALYQKIWMPEGSPLLVYSKKIATQLQQRLGDETKVVLGMRYGNPSISSALAELKKHNIKQLIILPLYPQYCAATTGSTFDAVAHELKNWRTVPAIQFINQYFDEPLYIRAIAEKIRLQWKPDHHLLFSFHGMPQRSINLGDPYQEQCLKTAQHIAEQLKLAPEQWQTVFQSRFGRAKWLQPYCDKTLMKLPKKGIKKVTVVCPGFSVDCLETLEEINQTNRALFLKAGGEAFDYVPALNDDAEQIEILKAITSIKH